MARRLHINVIHNTTLIAPIIKEARLCYNGQRTHYKYLAALHPQFWHVIPKYSIWNGDCLRLRISYGSWRLAQFKRVFVVQVVDRKIDFGHLCVGGTKFQTTPRNFCKYFCPFLSRASSTQTIWAQVRIRRCPSSLSSSSPPSGGEAVRLNSS